MLMSSVDVETSTEGLLDVPEHNEASRSLFGLARDVVGITVVTLVDVLEPFKTTSRYDLPSRSVVGAARNGAALDGEVPAPLSSTLAVPAVSLRRRILIDDVGLAQVDNMEDDGDGEFQETSRSRTVSKGVS